MAVIHQKNVFQIIKTTLNCVDSRLMDHGQRVAFLLLRLLEAGGIQDPQERDRICILGLLHDIGAYKTEEIDRMLEFESYGSWEHSIYGYLFVKNLSPLRDKAQAILYHHLDYKDFPLTDCEDWLTPSLIKLADRVDILISSTTEPLDLEIFQAKAGQEFSPQAVQWLLIAGERYDLAAELRGGFYGKTILELMQGFQIDDDAIRSYLQMLAYSIDFRSEYTVNHTIKTVSLSMEIAKVMGFKQENLEKIYFGALLHDLGKIAIPVSILEKQGSLTPDEMKIMRTHVVITGEILRDFIDEEIYELAVRHHEKLDGSGYPLGLQGAQLTLGQRIIAVADIISALQGKRSYKAAFDKQKVQKIIRDMSQKGLLCPETVATVLNHYDPIMANAEVNCQQVLVNYSSVKQEFEMLRQQVPIGRT